MVVTKGTLKRKNNGKDDRPNKKGIGPSVGDKQLKHPSPPKPSHGVGKGLMTGKGPVVPSTVRRLLTHKDHVIEMIDSIIKETNLDSCADQTTKDLGGVWPFLLVQGTFLSSYLFMHFLFILSLTGVLIQVLVQMRTL